MTVDYRAGSFPVERAPAEAFEQGIILVNGRELRELEAELFSADFESWTEQSEVYAWNVLWAWCGRRTCDSRPSDALLILSAA